MLTYSVVIHCFPENCKVFSWKVVNGATIYMSKQLPTFIDIGKNEFIPTMRTIYMSDISELRVMIVDDFVRDRILKGADLLSPALENLEAINGLKVGDHVILRSNSSPRPFAIGVSTVDASHFSATGAGKGVIWKCLHHIYDSIQVRFSLSLSLSASVSVSLSSSISIFLSFFLSFSWK